MTKLKIEGMSCQHCVAAVNGALAHVSGVTRVASVDLETGTAEVEGNADIEVLLAAVREEGYEAEVA